VLEEGPAVASTGSPNTRAGVGLPAALVARQLAGPSAHWSVVVRMKLCLSSPTGCFCVSDSTRLALEMRAPGFSLRGAETLGCLTHLLSHHATLPWLPSASVPRYAGPLKHPSALDSARLPHIVVRRNGTVTGQRGLQLAGMADRVWC
jgi:hypothetical protein